MFSEKWKIVVDYMAKYYIYRTMVDQTYPKEGYTNTESQSQTNDLSLPVQYFCHLPDDLPFQPYIYLLSWVASC